MPLKFDRPSGNPGPCCWLDTIVGEANAACSGDVPGAVRALIVIVI